MTRYESTLGPDYFNPDGSRKTPAERASERRKAHYEQQIAERNKPKPEVELLSKTERDDLRQAEKLGQSIAEQSRKSRESNEPRNFYRDRADAIRPRLSIMPELRSRVEMFDRKADELDEQRAAEKEAKRRAKEIKENPRVVQFIEYADIELKTCDPSEREELVEIRAIGRAGEVDVAWERMKVYEQRKYTRQDAALQATSAQTAEQLGQQKDAADKLRQSSEKLATIEANMSDGS